MGTQQIVNQQISKARKLANLKQGDVASATGISRSSISKMENGDMEVDYELIMFYYRTYHMPLSWLMAGEGEEKIKSIDLKEGGLENEKPDAKIVPIDLFEDFIELPYIPLPARASFVEMLADESFEHQYTFRVYSQSPEAKQKGAIVIEVNGDSMEPQLKHGSKVLAVPIPTGDWCYQSGKVYAVVYANYFVIKRILQNDLLTGKSITLSSDNPKGGQLSILGKDIRAMWRVVEVVQSQVE